jgi:hypothetical protein
MLLSSEYLVPHRDRDTSIVVALYALSVQATGEKGEKYMKAKIRYTDEPLGKLRIIDDFLPPPEDLLFKEENVKITITLSKDSVNFFKNEAKKHNTQYQKMIRRLLDLYAAHHKQPPRTNQLSCRDKSEPLG